MSDTDPKSLSQDGALRAEMLLRLAREKSVDSRNRLAEAVVDLFSQTDHVLSDRERVLMGDILKRVLREIEHTLRQRISTEMASRPDAPPELIRMLANDDIDVAFPILSQSRVLNDTDLIEVIHNRTLEHQLAIAVRYQVTIPVSDALVAKGDSTVIAELLRNPNAAISEATMDYLVDQSRRVDAFQEPILRRQDLPPHLAKRMFMWVSAALRSWIVQEFPIDRDTLDSLLEQAAVDGVTRTDASRAQAPTQMLADKLDRQGAITVDMLIDSLNDGEIALFIQLFVRKSALREALVQRILYEPGGEGLAIVCKAMGCTRQDFSVLFLLSRWARPSCSQNVREAHTRIMHLFERLDINECRIVLHRWQRDEDYLKALLEVDDGLARADEALVATAPAPAPASPRPRLVKG